MHPHRAFGSTYALPMTMCIQGEVNYVQHTAVVPFAMRHMYEYLYAVSLKSSSICILTAPSCIGDLNLRMALVFNGTECAGNRYGYRYGYKYGYRYGYGKNSYYSTKDKD